MTYKFRVGEAIILQLAEHLKPSHVEFSTCLSKEEANRRDRGLLSAD